MTLERAFTCTVCACVLSHLGCVWLFAIPWACQAPRSMGFSKQKYFSRLLQHRLLVLKKKKKDFKKGGGIDLKSIEYLLPSHFIWTNDDQGGKAVSHSQLVESSATVQVALFLVQWPAPLSLCLFWNTLQHNDVLCYVIPNTVLVQNFIFNDPISTSVFKILFNSAFKDLFYR